MMITLRGDTAAILIGESSAVLRQALRLAPERAGGYLCVADARVGIPVLLWCVGAVADGKVTRYCTLAQEKARRLFGNPHHVSSWQSREPEEDRWGGAVRGSTHILSFSGLPEHLDEATMLALALRLRQLGRARAGQVASLSANPHLQWALEYAKNRSRRL